MTEEEKKARKKQQQRRAYERWRDSEKGKAYRQRRKERQILGERS